MSAQPTSRSMPRTALFIITGLAALALAFPASIWLARSDADAAPIDRLGGEIGCSCGTCPMRPIATCGCGFADGMLARLQEEIDAGRNDQEIMATFVAEYGPGIRIKPDAGGFDLAAWFAPIALLLVGAVALAAVIARWRAEGTEAPDRDAATVAQRREEAPDEPSIDRGEDAGYREIVEQELDAFDA